MKYQIPKGLFDILPCGTEEEWRDIDHWQHIESIIHGVAKDYCYKEIRTPVFERTELFQRGVGAASDIVTKEMYTFKDKADRSMTLRPEGTSSILRAFIERHLDQHAKNHKLYYLAPMFRYERPQAGRYRQHHQFGVEAIGSNQPEQDAEVIDLLCELYRRLGLKNLTVMLNSVGDPQSRIEYKKALKEYLHPHLAELSKDSQERFEKKPLRILDSKEEKDQKILKDSPSLLDHLSEDAKDHFEAVQKILKQLKIPYAIKVNDKIVRGLDYYTRTVFEVISTDLGAQNAIGAGGRYDGLIKSFGGPDLPGIGFGSGIERILQTMIAQNLNFPILSKPFVYFIPLGEKAQRECLLFTTELRKEGIPADIALNVKKIHNALSAASSLNSDYAVIIGEEELKKERATVKELVMRKEKTLELEDLLNFFKELYNKEGQ